MAGEAPNYHGPEGRIERWLRDLPDSSLALYMLALALAIAATILAIDLSLLR